MTQEKGNGNFSGNQKMMDWNFKFVCLQGFTSFCGCVVQRGKTERKQLNPRLNPLWTSLNKDLDLSCGFLIKTSDIFNKKTCSSCRYLYPMAHRHSLWLIKIWHSTPQHVYKNRNHQSAFLQVYFLCANFSSSQKEMQFPLCNYTY